MTEKRATPRHRVLKTAKIEFGGSTIDCSVRNLSKAGAALEVASPVGSPFVLHESGTFVRLHKRERACSRGRAGTPFVTSIPLIARNGSGEGLVEPNV
jgi:hypothetical protein